MYSGKKYNNERGRWNLESKGGETQSRLFTEYRGFDTNWAIDSPISSPLTSPTSSNYQEARDLLGPSFWKSSTQDNSSLFSRDWFDSNDEPCDADHFSEDSKPSPLKVLLESRQNVPDSSSYAVLKINQIPWDTTHQEIREFLEPHVIPRHHLPPYYMEGIHMILNRETGRTLHECYIEVPDMDVARDILQDKCRKRQVLNGKFVRVEMSSQRELRMALFPNFTIEREKTGIQSGAIYLTRDEISFLLSQCRAIRYHSPRKSKAIERPFENVISVISKIPWHDEDGISTLFRDHLFEMLKLSIEALKNVNSKQYSSLVERLIRAGLCVPLFTEKQKLILLNVAHMQCPREMIPFVYSPITDDGESLHEHFAALGFSQSNLSSMNDSSTFTELQRLLDKSETENNRLCNSLNDLTVKYQKLKREHDELDYEYRKLANDHQKLQYQCQNMEQAYYTLKENTLSSIESTGLIESVSTQLVVPNSSFEEESPFYLPNLDDDHEKL